MTIVFAAKNAKQNAFDGRTFLRAIGLSKTAIRKTPFGYFGPLTLRLHKAQGNVGAAYSHV